MSSTPKPAGDEATALITQLARLTPSSLSHDKQARYAALALSRQLTAVLEGPVNRATELTFKPMTTIAAQIGVRMNFFSAIVDATTNSAALSISSAELAEITGADALLVSRILRVMSSIDFVTEVGKDEWRANETTKAMATPEIAAGHRFVYTCLVQSAVQLPRFLSSIGWQSPEEPRAGVFQFAQKTEKDMFSWLVSTDTENGLWRDFNTFMGHTMGAREYWVEWWDVEGRLLSGFDERSGEGVLLVDVAGGRGHDVQAFCEKVGEGRGRVVLQEVRGVLDGIEEGELDRSVERMEYDFFSEQPVKGARAYFMHHILHDWSDKYCHMILKQLREAMTPGYSRLLIHDLILPDTGAAEYQARFDLTMMTFNSGMERSRSQWRKLMEEAGFKMLGLWEHFDADGIVEVEVAA
ncbi:S-adenosyl-L-methionine-dependent methyltransferase [Lophiotrema nucula]|uniref:S-adenosyl-L-methionine-dependent methyltransferase n=1 Tax=Lophiotrema nucula TaxID=690887 RepID=A0A6A5Z7V8_9PLEO|nr:S-adenosyl-L-methionine-dependent methyltransferase [Lophiotrema nucula]